MKRSGLERNRWVEPIDDFVRQYGHATPRWAVFLTYHIDLGRFARLVLPTLSRRGRRFRIVVLSDQGALEESLNGSRTHLHGAVNVHPIKCRRGGVFHPKLVFLRAGRHIRACFGSANLTDGGMGSNLELWTSTESREILEGIQHFLLALTRSDDLAIDGSACRNLRRAISGLIAVETRAVWSSLQDSFASRLRSGPERNAASAVIISPMYAADGGIDAARAAIPSGQAKLFTDVPVRVPKCSVFGYSPPNVADQADDATDSFPRILHAKAYVFRPRAGDISWAWLGSANFTAQALTKPLSKGGNVELMVRTKLPKDEADALNADLAELFTEQALADTLNRRASTRPKAAATILACELLGTASEPRLRIHSTQRNGRVILMNDGCKEDVAIKNGEGILGGKALRRLLPELDITAAHVFVLYQLVGRQKVPVVVNVPHVPPDDATGAHSHASIESLLDDLLGRVRISHAKAEPGDEQDGDVDAHSDDAAEEDDAESSEFERRLDQVRHQGEIDQLAVKAAMLKRLAVKVTANGAERDSMLSDILRSVLCATPHHLAPAIRSLFDDVEPSESA